MPNLRRLFHGLAASLTTVSGVLAATTMPAIARPITVIVSAGDLDRQNTPVPLTLPPELAGKQFELRGPGGRLPLDLDAQGAGVFVLPSLKKGKQARYQLHELKRPPSAAAGVEVVRDKDNVDVRIAGKRVLRYQADNIPPRPDIGAEFHRGGYLHPLFTPSGVQVTDDYPKDHKHHHGIWTAWTSTEYEGRKPDFWNVGGKKARKDHVSTGPVQPGAAAGWFTTQLSSTDLGVTPPRQVLKETWKVTVYRTHAKAPPYYLFDLDWTDEIVGSAPLVLPQYRYGGLGVRGHIDWLGKDRAYFLTSEGKDRSNGEDSIARWVHMGGKTGETLAGIAVLDHPSNFRAPQPVRIHPDQPFLCYSPPKAGKMSLDPGKPYTSRYRFVVGDGAPDRALLERLWNDYAHPPTVEVKPAAGRS